MNGAGEAGADAPEGTDEVSITTPDAPTTEEQ